MTRYIIPPRRDDETSEVRRYIVPPKGRDPRLPSTQSKGESPVSPVSPGKSGDSGGSGETRGGSVDGIGSARGAGRPALLRRDVIVSEDGRKVVIEAYDTGETVEVVKGDKVVRTKPVKFVLRYKTVTRECVSDCRDAVKEIARATHYNVSAKDLVTKIEELREEFETSEEIPLVDYVRRKYPDRLKEVERDPFKWILSRTSDIVGYERLKLLTFLSVVSSQMERVQGMSRVHIMLVGKSGAGKSSTVKSVLRYIEDTDMYLPGTRLTTNALGYMDIDTFDGKVLFIEQIDRQNINYLREMMTEERVCTLVPVKEVDQNGNERWKTEKVCRPGQSAVITTSVADDIDVDREQLLNRFLKVYVNPESVDTERVIEAIWTRRKAEVSEVDRLVFLAYLYSRPKFADDSDLLDKAKKFALRLEKYTREPLTRVTEVLRNLVIAVAIARGKTKVDEDDFQFVLDNFQLDILYNGLGLTERDVEFLMAVPDDGGRKSSEIADELKVTKQYATNVLKNLERKGLVEGVKGEGNAYTWSLTPLGRKVKALVTNVSGGVVELRDEKGEVVAMAESKFRPDGDRGGNSENALSGADASGLRGREGEADSVDKAGKLTFSSLPDGSLLKAYANLRGKRFTLREFFSNLGEEYADAILKWAERRGLVRRNVVDGEEYLEFV